MVVDVTRDAGRDDAPAQNAPVDALAAFRADLDAAEGLTLDGATARDDLRAARPRRHVALGGDRGALPALAARGYRTHGHRGGQLLRGEMPDALALAYDRLAAVDRHADDEDGDGVVADVVRVPARRGLAREGREGAAPEGGRADDRRAALARRRYGRRSPRRRPAPAPAPTTPTGTDAPRAAALSAEGGAVARRPRPARRRKRERRPAPGARRRRGGGAHLRDDATGREAWADHLAACGPMFAMAGSLWKARRGVPRRRVLAAGADARRDRGARGPRPRRRSSASTATARGG